MPFPMMLPGAEDQQPGPEDLPLQQQGAQLPGAVDPQQFYQQHQERTAQLQQQAQQNQVQQQDMALGQRMVKLFDPNVPKPAKEFLYREMSRQMGVDPKGQTSSELGKMLLSLDPQSQDSLRRNLVTKISAAKPGEVQGLIKGIMTGQVDGMSLIQLASDTGGAPEALSGAGTGEMGADTRRLPTVGETPQEYQRIEPQLQRSLGYLPSERARLDDFLKEGYALPKDPKEQQKLGTEVAQGNSNTAGLVTKAARLNALFAGKPEVLGIVGMSSQYIDSAIEQARGTFRVLFPDKTDGVNLDEAKTYARRILQKVEGAEGWTGIKRTAAEAGLVSSAMVDLAYSMATSRGIPGNRLTNAMINQHLDELGRSGSPEQFQQVLASTVLRSVEQNTRNASAKVGKPVAPDLTDITTDDLDTMATNTAILPKAYAEAIAKEAQGRLEGTSGLKSINRQSPTLEEEDATRRQDAENARRRANLDEERKNQAAQIAAKAEDRATRTEDRSNAREDRIAKAQEEQFKLSLRRQDFAEEKDRRHQIHLAFAELGKALATRASVSGSGGGGDSGGGQNAEAFRINPGQAKRQPPQPIDASRFQKRG